jgi:hypothetical protein
MGVEQVCFYYYYHYYFLWQLAAMPEGYEAGYCDWVVTVVIDYYYLLLLYYCFIMSYFLVPDGC